MTGEPEENATDLDPMCAAYERGPGRYAKGREIPSLFIAGWKAHTDYVGGRQGDEGRLQEALEREASLLARLGRIRAMAESDPGLQKALAAAALPGADNPEGRTDR